MAMQEKQVVPWSDEQVIDDSPCTDDGTLDFRGNPAVKLYTGGWKTSPYILGNHALTTIAFYGVATNLVLYLTRVLHEGNAAAAANYSNWLGTSFLTSLIGAFLGDAYWGRYWTAAIFSTIHLFGMILLTLSVTLPSLRPPLCRIDAAHCPRASAGQIWIFYVAIYSIALGSGGYQPCLSAFGADQFDELDTKEKKQQTTFFSVFYLALSGGALVSGSFLVYVEANAGWDWGFGLSLGALILANSLLFLGTRLYRHHPPSGNPLTRIAQVLVAAFRKWRLDAPKHDALLYEEHGGHSSVIFRGRKLQRSHDFTFLDRAATTTESEKQSGPASVSPWRLVTITQVEEVKFILNISPIWLSSIIFSAIYTQMLTLFIEQGATMDTRIGRFHIPPASISLFDFISVLYWAPVYDFVLVPLARRYITGQERGFSGLQRMGIGLAVMTVAMVSAAIVEIKRLQTAAANGLLDSVADPVPMSIFWQVPQYSLVGASEVFTYIGQLEFFYDQSPDAMRGLGSALGLTTFGLGNYVSSLLVTGVTALTSSGGGPGWIPANNLNRGHLDYFFWLLAGLSALNLLVYIKCAQWYTYTSTKIDSSKGCRTEGGDHHIDTRDRVGDPIYMVPATDV